MSSTAHEQRVLAGVTREVDRMFASIAELAEAATALLAVGAVSRPELAALHALMGQILRRHEGFAAGAGVVLAPDVLTDAPRCIEWLWADRDAGLQRLEVDLEPESVEFYDYTAAEWYRGPELTRKLSIAGPYVDYICTHKYTYTLSVPLVCNGQFAGIAGADILAEQVERAVVPALMRLTGVAVLTSSNGRIIASNTARFRPGTVLGRQEAIRDLRPPSEASAQVSLPWTLHEGPAPSLGR
ncbi:MAG: cache domain-containing protein [Solirubrobacteraceae bacterium]|jgi:hypothetical protein